MRRQRQSSGPAGAETDVAPIDRRIARLAERQSGVAGRAQLTALGLGPRAIDHRVAAGKLVVVHRGVYAVGHGALGPHGRAVAALLASGPDAVLSHRSSGALWGIVEKPPRAEVTARRARRSRAGLLVHVAALDAGDIRRLGGLPVTAPARTLVDLAGVLPGAALERALAEALVLGLVSDAQLEEATRRPRRGTAALAHLLGTRGAEPTRSELERVLLRCLSDAGLPRPRVNARLGRFLVDFLWRDRQLVVETDGWAAHGNRRAFERDRARDADLQAWGYAVLRFTWRQVMDEPLFVTSRIAALLARRGGETSISAPPPRRRRR